MESIILAYFCHDLSFYEKVSPLLKSSHLSSYSSSTVYKMINAFYKKYQKTPSISIIEQLVNKTKCGEEQLEQLKDFYLRMQNTTLNECQAQTEYILDEVKNIIKTAEIYGVVSNIAETISDKSADAIDGSVIDSLQEALSIHFDSDYGSWYGENTEARHKELYDDKRRIPFRNMSFNSLSGGGTPRGTVSYILGGTNVGKTYSFCSLASDYIMQGYNVYYWSFEMSEAQIQQRIDANLLNVKMDEHKNLEYEDIERRIKDLGVERKLLVKRDEAHKMTPLMLKSKIKEVMGGKNWKPDVIIIDYLKLMQSDVKRNYATHEVLESLTDELRNIADYFDCIIVSGNQIGRDAYGSGKIGLENTSGSFGSNFGADAVYSINRNAQLDSAGLIQVGCLKSRFADTKGKSLNMRSELSYQRIGDAPIDYNEQEIAQETDGNPFGNATFSYEDLGIDVDEIGI